MGGEGVGGGPIELLREKSEGTELGALDDEPGVLEDLTTFTGRRLEA